MMRKIILLSTFLSWVVCPLALKGISFPEQTSSEADLVVSVGSIAELREKLDGHPFAELASNPRWGAIGRFLAESLGLDRSGPLREIEKTLREDFDLSTDELFELFPGPLSLSCYGLLEAFSEDSNGIEFILMAAYVGAAEELGELMQTHFGPNPAMHQKLHLRTQREVVKEQFMGETLVLFEVFDGERTFIDRCYTLVDDILILAGSVERLRSAVEVLKDDGDLAVAESDSYLSLSEELKGGDLSVWVNFESITEPLGGFFHDLVSRTGLAMAGVTGQSLDSALSLGDLQAYGLELNLTRDGLSANSGIVYKEKSGLFSLAAYTGDALPKAGYVPENVASSSVVSFSLSEMLANLESLLKTASPALAPLVDIQLQNMKSTIGVDLRSTVLENFGSEMVAFTVLPQDIDLEVELIHPEQLLVIELIDAQALSQTLEALIDSVPYARASLETKEFEGQTIYTFGAPVSVGEEMQDLSFAITRNHLVFHQGSVSVLQEALVSMQDGRDGFWQLESTAERFEELEVSDPVARYYADLGQMIRPVLGVLSLSGVGMTESNEFPKRSDFPFALVSESYELPGGFFTRMSVVFTQD